MRSWLLNFGVLFCVLAVVNLLAPISEAGRTGSAVFALAGALCFAFARTAVRPDG